MAKKTSKHLPCTMLIISGKTTVFLKKYVGLQGELLPAANPNFIGQGSLD